MNELIKLNDQLWGAPAGVLVAIFAIALGYLLKTLPFFNNRYIPLAVVIICTAGFMLCSPTKDAATAMRIYLTRNFIIGFIIGVAAWMFHAQILKRWVDPKFFNDDGSTKFLSRKDAPPQPPPTDPTKP